MARIFCQKNLNFTISTVIFIIALFCLSASISVSSEISSTSLDVALIDAIRINDTSKVQHLLEQGANPNATDPNALTKKYPQKPSNLSALLIALDFRATQSIGDLIYKGYYPFDPPVENVVLVKALLKQGADVHARNEVGCTPLMIAAWEGRSRTVELLLRYGSDVNAQQIIKNNDPYQDGYTPLMFAIISGDLNTVRVLINAHADIDTIKTKRGFTALSVARNIRWGENPAVVTLIEASLKKN